MIYENSFSHALCKIRLLHEQCHGSSWEFHHHDVAYWSTIEDSYLSWSGSMDHKFLSPFDMLIFSRTIKTLFTRINLWNTRPYVMYTFTCDSNSDSSSNDSHRSYIMPPRWHLDERQTLTCNNTSMTSMRTYLPRISVSVFFRKSIMRWWSCDEARKQIFAHWVVKSVTW
jgi:hypothetical protein